MSIWSTGLAAVVALYLVPVEAQAHEGRRYALVIGANRGDPNDLPLLHAERDADRVAEVLTRLGEVPASNLVHARGPTAATVQEALAHLSRRIASEASTDPRPSLLLVYYSGHADGGSLHLGGTHLDFDALTAQVEQSPADLRVLMVDACRSGGLTRAKGARPTELFDMQVRDALRSSGMATITSSASDEASMESDRLDGGIFTHHLLAGLMGAADRSGDNEVSLTEAWHYAYTETLRATSAEREVQHPTYAFDLRGVDDVRLTRLLPGEATGSVVLDLAGDWMVFDRAGAGDLVTEVRASRGALLGLRPGTYLLRHRGDQQVRDGVFDLRAGETLLVGAEDLTSLPYGTIARKGWAGGRHSAWSLTLGGHVDGALLDSQGTGGGASLGVRVDTAALSVQLRARTAHHAGSTGSLDWTQDRVGAELTALKLFDLGRVAPGLGLRIGADAVLQRFRTEGEAGPRAAFVPRFGPVLRLDLSLTPRLSLGVEAGADAAFVRHERDGAAHVLTRVVPQAGLELVFYAF